MRSAGVIFKNSTLINVIEWLNQFGVKAYRENQWCYLSSQKEVIFYMWLYNTLKNDFESDQIQELTKILSGEPSVWISIQIPGRFDSRGEVRLFVITLLKEFEGIAFDDDTNHWWSLADIENDLIFDGHRFFDRR
jgi:hypothetical protein